MKQKIYRAFDVDGNLKAEAPTQALLASELGARSLACMAGYINTDLYYIQPWTRNKYKITLETKDIPKPKVVKDFIAEKYRCEIVDLPGEEWKEIPGYTGNFASNKGRLKFVDKYGNTRLSPIGASTGKSGLNYLKSSLYSYETATKINEFPVGRIVAKAFIDPELSLYEDYKRKVYYHNRNTTDNTLENLSILSHQEVIQKVLSSGGNIGTPKKACYAEKDGVRRIYSSVSDLMFDLTGKKSPSNAGRFYRCAQDGYKVCGYNVGYC